MPANSQNSLFTRFAKTTSHYAGRPVAFISAVVIVLVWGITGPLFGFSDTWQLVINTGTTIVTFLMVFLIQNTQNRDTEALQLKLDEIIRCMGGARNQFLDLEELDEKELDEIRKEYLGLAEKARDEQDKKKKDKKEINVEIFTRIEERVPASNSAGSEAIKMNRPNIKILPALIAGLLLLLPPAGRTAAQPNNGDFRKFLDSVNKRVLKTISPNRSGAPVLKFDDICRIETDYISKTVFAAYGSAFVASESVRTPGSCIYDDENAVRDYQNSTRYTSTLIGGANVELQEASMNALMLAVRQADAEGLSITPLDGSVAARRSYADTVRIWNSRFLRALAHWTSKGRIKPADAEAVKKMPVKEQVTQVLEWEKQGMYFSTDMTKSILYATAPPGTSQHISMLAFDVVNYGNRRLREILAENGWFQTIVTDVPHFTYLGRKESELAELGLRKVKRNGYTFWVPPL